MSINRSLPLPIARRSRMLHTPRVAPGRSTRCLGLVQTALVASLLTLAGLAVTPAGAQVQAGSTSASKLPPRLAFSQFFSSPIGPQGLSFSPDLLARQGQRVRLIGYMVAREHPQSGRFMFTPVPVRMSEHADGDADDLPPSTVTVLLPPDAGNRPVPHQDGLIELAGRLDVGRHEDEDGRVSWLRLYLDEAH